MGTRYDYLSLYINAGEREKGMYRKAIADEIELALEDNMSDCFILEGLECYQELLEDNVLNLFKLFREITDYQRQNTVSLIVCSPAMISVLQRNCGDDDEVGKAWAEFLIFATEFKNFWFVFVEVMPRVEFFYPFSHELKKELRQKFRVLLDAGLIEIDHDDVCDRVVEALYINKIGNRK